MTIKPIVTQASKFYLLVSKPCNYIFFQHKEEFKERLRDDGSHLGSNDLAGVLFQAGTFFRIILDSSSQPNEFFKQ